MKTHFNLKEVIVGICFTPAQCKLDFGEATGGSYCSLCFWYKAEKKGLPLLLIRTFTHVGKEKVLTRNFHPAVWGRAISHKQSLPPGQERGSTASLHRNLLAGCGKREPSSRLILHRPLITSVRVSGERQLNWTLLSSPLLRFVSVFFRHPSTAPYDAASLCYPMGTVYTATC